MARSLETHTHLHTPWHTARWSGVSGVILQQKVGRITHDSDALHALNIVSLTSVHATLASFPPPRTNHGARSGVRLWYAR